MLAAAVPEAVGGGLDPQSSSSSADKVKAAYLYNFSKFVNWPSAEMAGAFVICIEGAPGVYGFLVHDVNGTHIGQRTVVIRSVIPTGPKDDCSLLYVDASASPSASRLSAPLHALTVSDKRDFLRQGGMIELYEEGNRFRFNINLTNARAAGLQVSAPLLQLAAKVESE